ncbi:MAG: colanic acid biosynthesis glycosyltransferase WcaL [Acidobacteria bacterium]|nr:MAG: colanic acid biosynthesis glycosyltransferase WcaL [Acidobacteriota bacterium]
MRIAYIVKEFPRLSETFVINELLELERLGHEIVVYTRHTPREKVPHASLRRLQAEVVSLEPMLRDQLWESFAAHLRASRTLDARYDRRLEQAIALRSRREMRYWILSAWLAEDLARRGIDLVHAHFATGSASLARFASALSGVPYTFTAHAKDIYADDVDRGRLRDTLTEAAAVVTVSDFNKAWLERLAPEARIVRVYNGVPVGELARIERDPAPPESARLLFVGRLVEKKGLTFLLDAMARLRADGRNVMLDVVGTGPLEPALREQARSLGLDGAVTWCGAASQQDVLSRWMPHATLFVLPAVIAEDGDRDGLPTTLLEAMAAGVPIVSTWVTGIPEITGGEQAGRLVAAGDASALADAIARALDEPHETAARVAVGRERARRLFDGAKNVRELAGLFEEVTGQVPRRIAR